MTKSVLVGCEESGVVRNAFAARGWDAWSCDLEPSRSPGKHLQCDVMEAVASRQWDLIILHPPCTALSLSGNKHYGREKRLHHLRLESLNWTKALWDLARQHGKRACLEQPKTVAGQNLGKKSQTVDPWEHGHMEQKETWLWLWNLPPLKPTNNVYEEMMKLPKNQRERVFHMAPSETRARDRSVTYEGVAKAMASQWGNL